MSNKTLTSQAAITYAANNIAPVIDALATLDANATSQNKLLAYHVFETCMLAQGEKVTHAMLESAVNKPFDKRVSAKGRKVADYVINAKPYYDHAEQSLITVTQAQFQGDKPELHVMTVYGHIAAYERDQKANKADTKSVVEQALAASGLPIELADKQIKLAQDGNDAAMSFVKQATEKFTPAKKESVSKSETPANTLDAAMNVLIDMTTNGNEQAAYDWLENAIELLGFANGGENVTTEETPQQIAA